MELIDGVRGDFARVLDEIHEIVWSGTSLRSIVDVISRLFANYRWGPCYHDELYMLRKAYDKLRGDRTKMANDGIVISSQKHPELDEVEKMKGNVAKEKG